ncbi:ClpXP protease specificity-enhancing factor SspB [Pseudooceanicola sp.]|uniref:SspB family protein n=1 Tax=Pseudooceanicola sp. TaxID=1914328 RepID=UPI0026352E10|nr:ClpXP protease specificity-enhancing factor SspB [Pseudooceanicola sp.]MDF1854089.1 ClpXP protease specificity-enhancing factor SspB [Pseudooceanicola sp.]
MSDSIDYGRLMHRAMRGLIQQVLSDVARNGLPGEHHFFITFDTTHPDAELADWLKDRYPEEMTVVMQSWFDDLQVTDDGFSVTLNFGDAPERMHIPYDSIQTFVDPSVEFGLRFESHDKADDEPTPPESPRPLRDRSKDESTRNNGKTDHAPADVVQLDTFRK